MKKYFLYKIVFHILVFLLISSFAYAATLSKNIPKNIEPGNTLTVTFRMSGIEAGEVFSIEEMIVNELSIKDYKIEGAEKTETEAEREEKLSSDGKKTKYSWVYQATISNPKLTYTIDIPSTLEGNYVLDTIYILPPAKMDNIKSNLRIAKIMCGDGYCEGNENSDTCIEDCPKVEEKEERAKITGAATAEVEAEPNKLIGLVSIIIVVALGVLLYYLLFRIKVKQ